MAAGLEAEDRNLGGEQEVERRMSGAAAAQDEVARLRDDRLGGQAAMNHLRPDRQTARVPLVARVEHGDERPGVEQEVPRGAAAGRGATR
jgi:hypothetical protein